MADELCPTCHSRIGTQSTVESERAQGKEGTDSNENPVPRWTDDPLFTPRGFSGAIYSKRHNNLKKALIQEIQDTREAQELEAGITGEGLTDFSEIDVTNPRMTERNLIELRESTEKILNTLGVTLEDYFKLDDDEVEQPQNPKIIGVQTEWVDVDRGGEYIDKTGSTRTTFDLPDGTTVDSPSMPSGVRLRAIHIEDLRHPITIGVAPAIVISGFNRAFSAKLSFKKALFRDATPCGIEVP